MKPNRNPYSSKPLVVTTASRRAFGSLPIHLVWSVCLSVIPAAADVTIAPEITLTAPAAYRVVAGSPAAPVTFTATNTNVAQGVTFDVNPAAGSVGSLPATPWLGQVITAGGTGNLSATPNLAGTLAGQSVSFGLAASNPTWNSPVSASTTIGVVANRLLTGSVTINAGRHMAGLQPIGSVTLNGGIQSDSEATRITVNGGAVAQFANGLRLTSASNFTFNGAGQSQALQVAYYGPTGNYSISGFQLPGAGQSNYTDATGAKRQDFGGSWKTSAEYGNLFGEKRVFTEQDRASYYSAPGSNIAWRRPDQSGLSSNDPNAYVYKQELVGTPQPTISPNRSATNATGVTSSWELARGAGPLVNERVNPLISGEVIAGSSLDLSGVTLNVTGTAVADRQISGGIVYLGRQMVGAANQVINRSDTVTLSTSGSDDHATRLGLGAFNLNDGGTTTAAHVGSSSFTGSGDTASIQITGNFTIDSSVLGRVEKIVDAGSSISGEGLAGEHAQGSLKLGYQWNNVQNNQLAAQNLLVIESSSRSDTRSYSTYVSHVYSTETHTNIGASGNQVDVSGTFAPGLTNLGNTTVHAVAEGLAGENATATATFNTKYASVSEASFQLTHTGAAAAPLTEGSVITVRDTGSGIYQNEVQISGATLTGGQSLDYQLVYSGGDSRLDHGQTRTFTVDYTGNTAVPAAGQLGRVSKANLGIFLTGQVNYNEIVSAAGAGGSRIQVGTGGNGIANGTFQLETRFDAPAAAIGSSTVPAGSDFGVNGLALANTSSNTSGRFSQTTNMELLDSKALAAAKTVQVQFVSLTNSDPVAVAALENSANNAASLAGIYSGGSDKFASDVVNLSGLNGVVQVLQVGYDTAGPKYEEGAQLLWKYSYTDGGGLPQVAWINAVLGNSDITNLNLVAGTLIAGGIAGTIQDYLMGTRHGGSYLDYLATTGLVDPQLGAWGLDTDKNKVWAVIDHNSSFAAAIPEPSLSAMLLVGAGCLLARRRKN